MIDRNIKREIMLDNYQNPMNRGLINDTHYIKENTNNESCIDNIDIELKIEDGKIKHIFDNSITVVNRVVNHVPHYIVYFSTSVTIGQIITGRITIAGCSYDIRTCKIIIDHDSSISDRCVSRTRVKDIVPGSSDYTVSVFQIFEYSICFK